MVSKPFVSDFAGPLRHPNAPHGTIPGGFANMALWNKGFKKRQRPDSSCFCGILAGPARRIWNSLRRRRFPWATGYGVAKWGIADAGHQIQAGQSGPAAAQDKAGNARLGRAAG